MKTMRNEMSMKQFNISNLKNEYGLSCIEDYILYLLSEKKSEWEGIFCESFLCFDKVLEFISHGQSYSHFTGVPRLQETAEKLGLIKLTFINDEIFSYELVKNEIFLFQVSEEFIKEKFNKVFWRNDHFMLFQYRGDGEFDYINDIPSCVGKISTLKMSEIYAKTIIKIDICENSYDDYKKGYQEIFTKNLLYEEGKYDKAAINFEILRDAIGISKVMVKRMEAFVRMFCESFSAYNYYNFLSDNYVKAEYMRVRGKEMNGVNNMINEIEEEDKKFKENLIEAVQTIMKSQNICI